MARPQGSGCDAGAFEVVNTPPTAVDDAFVTAEDTVLNDNVLANDSDAEGNGMTATLVSLPTNGTVELQANGSFSYTPTLNFYGQDTRNNFV